MTSYADYRPLTFHDAARRFTDSNDNPRAYLERCLETIAAREPEERFTAASLAPSLTRRERQSRMPK